MLEYWRLIIYCLLSEIIYSEAEIARMVSKKFQQFTAPQSSENTG